MVTLSRLCMLSVCNISRKVCVCARGGGVGGVTASGAGQTSGQFQQGGHGDLSSQKGLFDLSAHTPQVSRAGSDVSTSVKSADTLQFHLIAVEVPPSGSQQSQTFGPHCAESFYKTSNVSQYGVSLGERTGEGGLCKWLFPELE